MGSRSTINYATFFVFEQKVLLWFGLWIQNRYLLTCTTENSFSSSVLFLNLLSSRIWIRSYLIPQDLYISDCETVWEHFSSAILFAYFSRHTYWASCIGHAILWDMIFSALKMSCHLFRPYIPIYWCNGYFVHLDLCTMTKASVVL